MIEKLKKSKLTASVSKSFPVKLLLIFVSIFGIFLITGLLYFRNDVKILDGEIEKTVYTVNSDPYQILKEHNIGLGFYDHINFTGFEGEDTATLTVERAFPVKVMVDGKEELTAYSIDGTVSDALEMFGIKLNEYDTVTPAPREKLTEGDVIEIRRAYDVKITADGETVTTGCLDNTVAELLDRAGITLGEFDTVNESLNKQINESCELKVSRVRKETTVSEKVDKFKTTHVRSNVYAKGVQNVKTEGVDGVVRTTVTKTYVDGKFVGTDTAEQVISKRVDEVIEDGAAAADPYCKLDDPRIILDDNGRPVNYEYIVSGAATAYTAPRGAYTASGRPATIGTCAVNPNQIPYGSLVYIVAQNDSVCYGYAIAADTGDGMMDGTIPVDVYMGDMEDHYDDSCRWGYRIVDIFVIAVGNG